MYSLGTFQFAKVINGLYGYTVSWNFQTHRHDRDIFCNLRSHMNTVFTETMTIWKQTVDSENISAEFRDSTLGMVGVVGVFVAKIVGHFGGPKGAKIHREAPICSSSQQSAMAVLSAQKVSAKKVWKFWDIQRNIFDPVCPIVKFQKNRNLESGVVLLCWYSFT